MNFLPYVVEFIGTFVFLSIIINYAKPKWGAFAIGLGLTAAILFGGAISGGHFNPAVSIMMLARKQISNMKALGYITAQVLGGLSASYFMGLKAISL